MDKLNSYKNKYSIDELASIFIELRNLDVKVKTTSINDLSNNGKATGELIKIEGKILDKSCKPYPFCEIDIWHYDENRVFKS